MLTRTKVFSLTIAALLVLTLAPDAPFGYAQDRPTGYAVGEPFDQLRTVSGEPQGRLTTAALPPANPSHLLSPAADAENVEFVGHIGGTTEAVAVQGKGLTPRIFHYAHV